MMNAALRSEWRELIASSFLAVLVSCGGGTSPHDVSAPALPVDLANFSQEITPSAPILGTWVPAAPSRMIAGSLPSSAPAYGNVPAGPGNELVVGQSLEMMPQEGPCVRPDGAEWYHNQVHGDPRSDGAVLQVDYGMRGMHGWRWSCYGAATAPDRCVVLIYRERIHREGREWSVHELVLRRP